MKKRTKRHLKQVIYGAGIAGVGFAAYVLIAGTAVWLVKDVFQLGEPD